MLRVGSLFSGYGGLDLAVLNIFDAEVVWHCEWDDEPSKILDAHWPGVPNFRDVSKVDFTQVPQVDVLTGGFPCQDLSLAGKRAGLVEGTRSGLWHEFARAISELQPKLVVIENVRGILSAKASNGMEYDPEVVDGWGGEPVFTAIQAVLGSLADLGYDARWTGLRAADAGAPKSRIEDQVQLIPTPTTRDYKDGQAEHQRAGVVQTDTVARAIFNSGEVNEISWGKFEPAIRRWEAILGRVAPAPTKPDGKDGAHRLSSEFTEWMMGVPAGWITGVGLKRNSELKACGNGVVPQQAELALRILLEGLPFDSVIRGGLDDVLPTPTVMDQRDGKSFRTVAIKNLAIGKNRGLNLNNVVEAIGVDWQDGDTFEMVDGELRKNSGVE